MNEYLVYWKHYWSSDHDPPGLFHWACRNARLWEAVAPGDALWVVVPGGSRRLGEWRLLERIVVRRKEHVPNDSEYGPFHFVGVPKLSRRFNPRAQSDFTPVLRSLRFATGKSISLDGALIGRAIQTARRLDSSDPDRMWRFVRKR